MMPELRAKLGGSFGHIMGSRDFAIVSRIFQEFRWIGLVVAKVSRDALQNRWYLVFQLVFVHAMACSQVAPQISCR